MRHVVGLSTLHQEPVWPLEVASRIRFDTNDFHSLGYFSLVSRRFDKFAHRDASIGIDSMNAMFVLRGNDLTEAIELLTKLEAELNDGPTKWRTYLGELHPPHKAPPFRIEPLLFRHRALSIISQLRSVCVSATAQGRSVVYGNGVLYRHLCGIKLPPGTVVYS